MSLQISNFFMSENFYFGMKFDKWPGGAFVNKMGVMRVTSHGAILNSDRKTAEEILGAVGRVQQRTKNQNDNLSVTRVPEMTKIASGDQRARIQSDSWVANDG